jgi:predicted acylesterase/phospholipase RssA
VWHWPAVANAGPEEGPVKRGATTKGASAPEADLASGALPPGFPAAEIEGEYYWDGGLISNTPLDWVVESGPGQDTLAFQVNADLPLKAVRGSLEGLRVLALDDAGALAGWVSRRDAHVAPS